MTNPTQIPALRTKQAFAAWSEEFRAHGDWKAPLAFALGSPIYTANGTMASVRYPVVNGPGQSLGTAAAFMHYFGIKPEGVQIVWPTTEQLYDLQRYFTAFSADPIAEHQNILALARAGKYANRTNYLGNTPGPVCLIFFFDDVDIAAVPDATLKLYLMSLRYYRPNTLNLKGIFGALPNMVWIDGVPYDTDAQDARLLDAAFSSDGRKVQFTTDEADKFPFYTDHINPLKMGVRICDPHKVRLGAHLGIGTTVMPGASYVNFNAGTAGAAMVEGRISSAAFVGEGSDIGGGASILGTLSGGNETPIYMGKKSLLGANSCLGISIGDCVILSACQALMEGTDIFVSIAGHPQNGQHIKAADLQDIKIATFVPRLSGGLRMIRTERNLKAAREAGILNRELHANN